ncbi:MAG TPA: DMT family transporter [Xanthobacteraceae bacterium]|nr:DMT family transporter [Xanthobacteraceae bacterium]
MNPLFGILLQIFAMLCFTTQGAFVRYVGDRIPVGEIVFARSFFGLLPLILWLMWQGKFKTMWQTSNLRAHLTRGVVNLGGMFCNFAGLARIPLADATALGYATPLFTVILAAMFLGEVVRLWRWLAVMVGLGGVLLMLSPHLGQGSYEDTAALGAVFALSAAFLFGVAMTQIRHMAAKETTGALVFFYSAIGIVVSLCTIYWGWVIPAGSDLIALVVMGILGGMAQILMTESFRRAEAAVLAPFAYTSMIWAVLIGYFWFGEVPAMVVLAGAAIVIASGLFVIWREHKLGLDRKRPPTSAEPPV